MRVKEHPLYSTWACMMRRCCSPQAHNYKWYGGRGIGVCERWRRFANFAADMGERPPGTTLDRKDSDGDYGPDNCRWATKFEQANNARSNRKFWINGELIGQSEAGRKYGVGFGLIYARINKLGWPIERAVLTPPRKMKSRERAL